MVIGLAHEITAEDEGMMLFVLNAFAGADKLEEHAVFPENVNACFDWIEQYSAEEANIRREAMICAIEADAVKLQESGAVDSWFGSADAEIRAISNGVNGVLFDRLSRAAGHEDIESIDQFRHGAQFLGKQPRTGNGEPVRKKRHESIPDLHEACGRSNREILSHLNEDIAHSEFFG